MLFRSATSPITVTGLNSQTSYTFTVKGNNVNSVSGPNSSASSSVTATTVPQAPTIGTFTDGGTGTSGSLTFTAGATGGKLITDYKYSTDGTNYTITSGAWVQTGKGAYVYTPVQDRIRMVQAGSVALINGIDSGMRLSHTCPWRQ